MGKRRKIECVLEGECVCGSAPLLSCCVCVCALLCAMPVFWDPIHHFQFRWEVMIAWRIQQKLRRLRVKTKQNQAHTNNTRNKRRSTEQKAVRGRNSYKHFGGSCHFRWHRSGQVRQRYMMIGLRICIFPLYILWSRCFRVCLIGMFKYDRCIWKKTNQFRESRCVWKKNVFVLSAGWYEMPEMRHNSTKAQTKPNQNENREIEYESLYCSVFNRLISTSSACHTYAMPLFSSPRFAGWASLLAAPWCWWWWWFSTTFTTFTHFNCVCVWLFSSRLFGFHDQFLLFGWFQFTFDECPEFTKNK